jgi:hypothetical protein
MDTMSLSTALSQLDIVPSQFIAADVTPAWSPHGATSGQAMLLILLRGSGNIAMDESVLPMHAGPDLANQRRASAEADLGPQQR